VDDPRPSDAIVVLMGGISHRPRRAAELYQRGIAPVVVLGATARDDLLDPDETARTVALLEEYGVPRSAIRVLPGQVTSTRDEALLVRAAAAAEGWHRLTLVTTAFHTRRARWIFEQVLGKGVVIHAAAATHPRYDEATWYHSDEGLVLYFSETLKLLYYWLLYRGG
jgi:uncharacterized SAM-binding protein YcdF (DUF218 family)